MSDFTELVLPIEPKPITLRLKFNNSAYRLLEKLTGRKHFDRDNTNMLSAEFCVCALFAGTRKHHSHPTNVDLDQINEWLDAVPSDQLNLVYATVVQIYMESFLSPLQKAELEKQKKAAAEKDKANPASTATEATVEGTRETPMMGPISSGIGSPTLSNPLNQASP